MSLTQALGAVVPCYLILNHGASSFPLLTSPCPCSGYQSRKELWTWLPVCAIRSPFRSTFLPQSHSLPPRGLSPLVRFYHPHIHIPSVFQEGRCSYRTSRKIHSPRRRASPPRFLKFYSESPASISVKASRYRIWDCGASDIVRLRQRAHLAPVEKEPRTKMR
ncbi:hypothetical protein B0H11DRAFT_231829 [Mycena galericulata]|nr:hypothetical protein B0H11DRAFT_231829 [Mycena galericulata]